MIDINAPEKAAVNIEDLSLSFSSKGNDQTIFSSLNLSFEKGKFISILGPSGCGKSTLLRVISGLIDVDSGEVLINGNKIQSATSDASFMFQNPTLLPWLNSLDNVLFPIKHTSAVKETDKTRALELLSMVGLAEHTTHMPSELSGGMQQRAALARALMTNHDLMLMDEPFSALDALSREKLGFELLNILAGNTKTILFVTHSIPEAVVLSDYIFILGKSPANLVDAITVDLPYPRSPATMLDPGFSSLCASVRRHFYAEEDHIAS